MSKKRGLSFEEKRSRMMEIFFDKKEFFHLKELEKIAPKSKGITPMSVKEVLQSLVDDGMVKCERVGSSCYYWAFKSEVLNNKQCKLDNLKKQVSELEEKNNKMEKNVTNARVDRQACVERENALSKVSTLLSEKKKFEKELGSYKENDPSVITRLVTETTNAREAANRWTDNLLTLKSWIKRKFPIEEKQIDKQFGIPEDMDYIE